MGPLEKTAFLPNVQARAVLLGASNLTRGISTVATCLASHLATPFDLYLAYGFGRSFGIRSHVMGRDLPGIVSCGLWDALSRAAASESAHGRKLPEYVLISDVGNDVLYQQPVAMIVSWVRSCLERLAPRAHKIILAQLPMENVARATQAQFLFLTKMLFPGRVFVFEKVREDLQLLAGALEDMAREFGATLVQQPAAWYGFDPIHYKFNQWPAIWPQVLAPFGEGGTQSEHLPAANFAQWVRFRRAAAEHRWVLGREWRTAQPSQVLPDGTRVFSY